VCNPETRLQQNSRPHRDAGIGFTVQEASSTRHTPRKAGGKPGHLGHRPAFCPYDRHELLAERCACGNTTFALVGRSTRIRWLERPPISLEVIAWVLLRAWCSGVWSLGSRARPFRHARGYGPRFKALMGALAGTSGNGRRMVRNLLRPRCWQGAIQRSSIGDSAIAPDYVAIVATHARPIPVNLSMKPRWFCRHTLQLGSG